MKTTVKKNVHTYNAVCFSVPKPGSSMVNYFEIAAHKLRFAIKNTNEQLINEAIKFLEEMPGFAFDLLDECDLKIWNDLKSNAQKIIN